MADVTDDRALLCERCGYPIGDLAGQDACPECGLAIGESDPARRVGSPWQRKPSSRSWMETLGGLARRPRRLFELVRVDASRCAGLLGVNLAIAGSLVSMAALVPWFRGYLLRRTGNGVTDQVLTFFFAWAILWTGAFWLLWLLTRIEWRGIRFFGIRRGWRITPDAATAVVSHASYGWILAGLLALAGVLAGMLLAHGGSGPPVVGLWIEGLGLSGTGFFLGLLVFETLVYVGVRGVRYANPGPVAGVREGSPSPPAPRTTGMRE